MDVCRKMFGRRPRKENNEKENDVKDENIYREADEDVAREQEQDEATKHDGDLLSEAPGGPESDQEANHEEECVEDLTEAVGDEELAEKGDTEAYDYVGEGALADAIVSSVKKGHEVAPVYNYVVAQAIQVYSGIPHRVLDKIEQILPTVENVEKRYRIDLDTLGLDHLKEERNPFKTLLTRLSALKYLLQDHIG